MASFIWPLPKVGDLVEHRGHLLSFYILHESDRPWVPLKSKTWYDTVWSTTEGDRYFSDSLNERRATDALQHPGSVIVCYAKPKQRLHTLENGEKAIPTYGLSVDGHEIQSVGAALGYERHLLRFLFPIVGILSIGVGFVAFRQDTRRARELHLTSR